MPPKDKIKAKSGPKLKHAPLGSVLLKPVGKLRVQKRSSTNLDDNEEDNENHDLVQKIGGKIAKQAKQQRIEDEDVAWANEMDQNDGASFGDDSDLADQSDDDDDNDLILKDGEDYEDDGEVDLIEVDGNYISGAGLTDSEEAVVNNFLNIHQFESRNLADIIMQKLREKDEEMVYNNNTESLLDGSTQSIIPQKVLEVYNGVGKMLAHYKSGKLPKALKMLPHLKNWERILWITRPDEWSPAATFACTRIFSSNLNAKMAQRFYNIVLLEKCRDDIRVNDKLNYYLYMALKKALFKPAAFYKGLLLPLAQSRTCTLREATIIGSVLMKVSIPSNHSAAVLLRLAEMPYSGSTSLFIKILLSKKYALPIRVINALVVHFTQFTDEKRLLPVIWHQSLLVFVQRYKRDLTEEQTENLRNLIRIHNHHQITPEVRRELITVLNPTNNFK
eukprot:gene12166-16293_t